MRRLEKMIIDTHAHYDDEAFDTDREALLTSMYDGGIEKIVNVCASVGGFQDTVDLMEKYPLYMEQWESIRMMQIR